MTDDLASPRITTSSAISIGLVIVLIAGAIGYGRQTQRLDSIDQDVTEMRTEIKQVRDLLLRNYQMAPPVPR